MYIAFKWLVGLSFVMWLTMCLTDVYVKINMKNMNTVTDDNKQIETMFKNITMPVDRNFKDMNEKINYNGMAVLHGAMFFAGAIAVLFFNRKSEVITYMRLKLSKLNASAITEKTLKSSYETVSRTTIATVKYLRHIWEIIFKYIRNINILLPAPEKTEINKILYYVLLKKFKYIVEERRTMGNLLVAAIQENKNIRMQYQLETMAKSRLVRYMDDSQKQIKDNRSRYNSFQHLYIITHQENAYLKARVGKLIKEKNEAENNLMVLMNAVYKSKSKELKAFCSRFIVKTKDNLLNSDVRAEIHKFIQKSCENKTCASNWQKQDWIVPGGTNNWPTCTRLCDRDIPDEDSIVPIGSDAPKLKGLHGEYAWTVKDRNGIIEKLYEYDYESDYDNGDTIRRIRQYSVYYDKDCLLDFSNSKTVIHEINTKSSRNRLLKNEKFLTGSEAFQQFLKCNENFVPSSRPTTPTQRLLCG